MNSSVKFLGIADRAAAYLVSDELMLDGLFCFQVKIDRERLCIVEDEVHDEITIEDLVEGNCMNLLYTRSHHVGSNAHHYILL